MNDKVVFVTLRRPYRGVDEVRSDPFWEFGGSGYFGGGAGHPKPVPGVL
jgi:hypothetical protein